MSRKVTIKFTGKTTLIIDEGRDIDDALADMGHNADGDFYDVEDFEIETSEIIDSR